MQSVQLKDQWGEERLRYRILRAIYERTEGGSERVVTGSELRKTLDLRNEDLFRVVHFLEHNSFLKYLGAGPRVCLTRKGQLYIEEVAARRQSIRFETRFDTLASGSWRQ